MPSGYRQLVRENANFRSLWFGEIVSLLGDWFNLIASAALVAELTASNFAVGALFVVRMLAPFFVAPFAGVVADQYNRKTILVLTDLGRAATAFGLLLVRSPQDVWLLYVLIGLQRSMTGFFFPTRNAILPDVVSPNQLGAANALSSATWSVMLTFGAALGGLVSGAWGIYPAFAIDGITFLVSALFIANVHYVWRAEPEHRQLTVRQGFLNYLGGFRYLHAHPDIWIISCHKAAVALLISSGFQVVQVAIAENVFVIGKAGGISLGLMFAVAGLGTGIGPIVLRRFTGDEEDSLRVSIIAGYLVAAVGLLIAASLKTFSVVLLGTLLRGIGGGVIWVFSTQLLMQLTPAQVRGRVFSVEFATFTLMSAVSASVAGRIIDTQLGIAGTLLGMAGLALIPAMLWTVWIRNTLSKVSSS